MACLSCHCRHCWNLPLTNSLCLQLLFSPCQCSTSIDECQWVPFFPHGGIHWHTFAPCTLPHQTPLRQTAPLLPSVTRQQYVMGCWWEGSTPTVPPTSTSDIVGQHNTFGGCYFQSSPRIWKLKVHLGVIPAWNKFVTELGQIRSLWRFFFFRTSVEDGNSNTLLKNVH